MSEQTISVVIPAYNSARTIAATLDSVLAQTVQPDEILVMNDGSTDTTSEILKAYEPRVTTMWQPNAGLASADNGLIKRAKGKLVAFLDSDDLWHPRYLEFQKKAFARYPNAILYFTGHIDFEGYGRFRWNESVRDDSPNTELIGPVDFLRRYYKATGPFTSHSYCCVRKDPLLEVESQPFKVQGADDSYLFTLVPLLGWPAVYNPTLLAAYRITGSSMSANTLWIIGQSVRVFETLKERYERSGSIELRREFDSGFASRSREYARLLVSAGRISEARRQFASAARIGRSPNSIAKSVALLLQTYLPTPLRPGWRGTGRMASAVETALGTLESD